MKRLLGISLVVITGALVSIVANSAVGDAIYVGQPTDHALDTAAKRQAMRDVVRELAPGIPLASVQTVKCWQTKRVSRALIALRPWRCTGERVDSTSASDLLDDVLLQRVTRVAGDGVKRLASVEIANTAVIDALTEAAFSLDIDATAGFRCQREPSGPPTCKASPILNATPDDWKTAYENGEVVGTIGKVE